MTDNPYAAPQVVSESSRRTASRRGADVDRILRPFLYVALVLASGVFAAGALNQLVGVRPTGWRGVLATTFGTFVFCVIVGLLVTALLVIARRARKLSRLRRIRRERRLHDSEIR
ncbi:MAG: hypothetical protein QM811_01275 [Pirellulales bacterium]